MTSPSLSCFWVYTDDLPTSESSKISSAGWVWLYCGSPFLALCRSVFSGFFSPNTIAPSYPPFLPRLSHFCPLPLATLRLPLTSILLPFHKFSPPFQLCSAPQFKRFFFRPKPKSQRPQLLTRPPCAPPASRQGHPDSSLCPNASKTSPSSFFSEMN